MENMTLKTQNAGSEFSEKEMRRERDTHETITFLAMFCFLPRISGCPLYLFSITSCIP